MKAVVAAFNQEKALVGAFSVITNLRMELFEALVSIQFITIQLVPVQRPMTTDWWKEHPAFVRRSQECGPVLVTVLSCAVYRAGLRSDS